MDYSPLLILLFGGLVGWLFRHWRSVDGNINGVSLTVIEQELDELYQLSAQVKPLEYELQKMREQHELLKAAYANRTHDTSPTALNNLAESTPDEVGELYQLVAKVKPLQYELSRMRKSNNSLAADKERVERRLRSQLVLHNQLQETHKLELAKSLATQLTQKEAKIAELQGQLEEFKRIQSDQSCDIAAQSLQQERQQLQEDNAGLQSELKLLQLQTDIKNADVNEVILRQKTELHNLQLQLEAQQIQLSNANERLIEVNQLHATEAEVLLILQKANTGKDEQLGQLLTQLDALSQTTNAALRDKDEATVQAAKTEILLGKAETRSAELLVQQTQAEQQWRYEMSSLQSVTAGLEELKVKDAEKMAELERTVSQGNSQRLVLESRLKTAEEDVIELDEALEKSQASAQSFSEYSKLAETKVIQLSSTLSEREKELETITSKANEVEANLEQSVQERAQEREQTLQQQFASEQAFAEKYNAAELSFKQLNAKLQHSEEHKQQLLDDITAAKQQAAEFKRKLQQSEANAADLNAALTLQRTNAVALEKQTKELEKTLNKAQSGSHQKLASLSEIEQRRLADAHKINELQALLNKSETGASQYKADSEEVEQLRVQILQLKNETSKYARFQQDAQATARELLEAKESLQELGKQSQLATDASARLTTSNIEIERLKKELNKANKFQHELREQSVVLAKLQAKLKQTTELQSALDEHQSRVSSLEQELKLREAALKAAQSQADKNAKRSGSRIDKASAALTLSKKRINELSKALSQAEAVAKQSAHNDLELRRLRSELRTLQAQRNKTVKALDTKSPDAEVLQKLEADIVRRDQQIEQLKRRLTEVQQAPQSHNPKDAKPKSARRSNQPHTASAAASDSASANKTPVLFAVPKEKDDLKRIKGIGPVMEKTLNKLGITSFKQIAGFAQLDIRRVSDAIETFPGRIERDDWVGGAKEQYKLKYENKAGA